MFLPHLLLILFILAETKPAIESPPALVLLNIFPDDFLKFFFGLGAAERSLIENSFLAQADKLTSDEKNGLFVESIRNDMPMLAERLYAVMKKLDIKKELLSQPIQELFDLLLIKPNVPENSPLALKKFTQLRLNKWLSLSEDNKKMLTKVFPSISSFFDSLIYDSQVREFVGLVP